MEALELEALLERLTDTAMAIIAQAVMAEVPGILPGALFANGVVARLVARALAAQGDEMTELLNGAFEREHLPWRLVRMS
jgi:hypothetical protein